jgi:ATP-dependent DNA ligase
LNEIKHDGFRTLVLRTGDRVRGLTRNGIDWTERFPMIFCVCSKGIGGLTEPTISSIAIRLRDEINDVRVGLAYKF